VNVLAATPRCIDNNFPYNHSSALFDVISGKQRQQLQPNPAALRRNRLGRPHRAGHSQRNWRFVNGLS